MKNLYMTLLTMIKGNIMGWLNIKKGMILILILMLSSLFLAQIVSSVGVSGKTLRVSDIFYEPGGDTLSYQFKGVVVPEGGAELTVEGDFADWIELSKEELLYDGEWDFTASIIMNGDVHPPGGETGAKVCVKEKQVSGTGMFGSVVQSCVPFEVVVLYDEAYPVLTMSSSVGVEEVNLTLSVQNYGKETMNVGSGEMVILDYLNSTIDSIPFGVGTVVQSQKITSVQETVNISNYLPGTYPIETNVFIDDEEYSVQGSFVVGKEDVTLVSFPETIILDGIQRVSITAKNEWADEANVGLELYFGDLLVGTSTPLKINAFGEGSYTIYADTSSFSLGEMTGKVVFSFGDGLTAEESVTFSFVEDGGSNLEENLDEPEGMNVWLIVGVIVVLLILLIGIILFIKSRSEDEFDDEEF